MYRVYDESSILINHALVYRFISLRAHGVFKCTHTHTHTHTHTLVCEGSCEQEDLNIQESTDLGNGVSKQS